jgi:hypothetical protein
VTRIRIDLEGDTPAKPIGHPSSYGKDQLPNSEQKRSQINLALVKNESFRSIMLSPKKVARNTSRKGNFVTHLTSSEYMTDHMNRNKSLQRKYQKNEIRIHKRVRLMILIESAVS